MPVVRPDLPRLTRPRTAPRQPAGHHKLQATAPGLAFARCGVLVLALGLLAAAAPVAVAATPGAKPGKSTKTTKAPTKATARPARRAKAPAPEPEPEPPPAPLSEAQLAVAALVYTGTIDCELKQQVQVAAIAERPGMFQLSHRGKRYTLVPEPTSTGAVRLTDAKAGIVWLQIPLKSMLMNTRIGQRLVDACQHTDQLAAQAEVAAAEQAASAAGLAAGPGLLAGPTPAPVPAPAEPLPLLIW